MSYTPETDSTHPDRIEGLCGRFEEELNYAVSALHQCYAATGEDAGDMGDFRALVDREKHTVKAVREMRKECDQWRECAERLAAWMRSRASFDLVALEALNEFERLKEAA